MKVLADTNILTCLVQRANSISKTAIAFSLILHCALLAGCASQTHSTVPSFSLWFKSDSKTDGGFSLKRADEGGYVCEFTAEQWEPRLFFLRGPNSSVEELFSEFRQAAAAVKRDPGARYQLTATLQSAGKTERVQVQTTYDRLRELFSRCGTVGRLHCDIMSRCGVPKVYWYYDLADAFYREELQKNFGR